MTNRFRTAFFSTLLRVRPAPLVSHLKRWLGIRREIFHGRHGDKFWIDPVSHFGLELLTTGTYEPSMTTLLEKLLRPGDTFVDIGGNEGYFSVLAGRLVGHGQVHCVEPQSRLMETLRKNFEINGRRNVKLHPVAISRESGKETLHLRPDTNTGASSLFKDNALGTIKEEVRVVTLDTLFKENGIERVRLMKIDCEGAEEFVMAGAGRVFLDQRVDLLALEYHPQFIGNDKCNDINRQLRQAGYRIVKADGMWVYHRPGLEKEFSGFKATSRIDWLEDGTIREVA